MDSSNTDSYPQTFGEAYKSIWVDEAQTRFNRTDFERFTDTINWAIAPLKPLLGLFCFTAFDEAPLWSDNSERFYEAWKNLVQKTYEENVNEIPLLFLGFATSSRLGFKRESWGLFLTDAAVYASVSLYGEKKPRRYGYPCLQDVFPGWASVFARQIVNEFDPEGIKTFAELTGELPSFDENDNAERLILGNISDPERMGNAIAACLVLALDALMGELRMIEEKRDAQAAEPKEAEPVSLTVRVTELGLSESIKFGSDPGNAKHFKKLASKLGMDADERIIFSFTDSTFAGVYGLAVTDRAIRSRDLMEEAVMQALEPGDITRNEYTLVIGGGPVHAVGEFVPERLMPSVVTLLEEYLAGMIRVD